jgi:inner membrane protein
MFDLIGYDIFYLGYAWLIAGLVLLLLEIGTPGLFVFISLSLGAFAAAVSAFLRFPVEIQCMVTVVVSLLAFWVTRMYVAKRVKIEHKTNTDALIGQQAVVIMPIEPNKVGRVKVQGEDWPAVTQSRFVYQKGTVVNVVAVQGNKLVVD